MTYDAPAYIDPTPMTEKIIEVLGGYDACSIELPNSFGRHIRAEAVPELADAMVTLIADLISSLIDAGSEREVIHEDEALRAMLTKTFDDWVL